MPLDDVPSRSDTPVARTQVNTLQPKYIPARILWPALGFPEIVDPGAQARKGDPTTCIRLLLIAAHTNLSAYDVARHLRWAAWKQRRTRFLYPGNQAFPPGEITVTATSFSQDATSELTSKVSLANGALAFGLATKVWDFYKDLWKDSATLYEITISNSASAALGAGQYNLFWINRDPNDTEAQPSQEMASLLEKFVKPRLAKEFPLNKWVSIPPSSPFKDSDEMAVEYEYEWNGPPLPQQTAQRRVEVLHPLFVGPAFAPDPLKIGHITDTHVGTREDVMEQMAHQPLPVDDQAPSLDQISQTPSDQDRLLGGMENHLNDTRLPKSRWKAFNNPNRRFAEIYQYARADCDVLLLTGDLVDFGRGHVGDSKAGLGVLGNYWLDRNWFMFYRLLAQDDLYSKPAYTSLGNHDWRINPYSPLNGKFKTNWNYNLSEDEMNSVHGPGAKDDFYMDSLTDYPRAIIDWIASEGSSSTMPSSGLPLVTTTHSVIWYMLLINPFLDYSVRLPNGYALLMLDWARDEQVITLGLVEHRGQAAEVKLKGGDPMAADSLTDVQYSLVQHFISQDVGAKILGIHAPLLGASSGWATDDLRTGWAREDDDRFAVMAMGRTTVLETPFPPEHLPAHGSIKRWRFWLIQQLRARGVSLVLSGHLHRHALFVIANPDNAGPYEKLLDGMALCLMADELNEFWPKHGPPLFVNTTSAGPIGHDRPFPGKEPAGPGQSVPESASVYVGVPPGWSQIALARDGTVQDVRERYGDWSHYPSMNYQSPQAAQFANQGA